MTAEAAFVAALREFATDGAARGLLDDAAVIEIAGRSLVLTKDMVVEGVHYLPDDPPVDVAWKLVAVNLSDLAAKGAQPIGVLLGYTLREERWDRAFADGLRLVLEAFSLPLLGGDTVRGEGARTLSLTALGEAPRTVPSRSGGRPGDHLWVTGTIGDAGAGLRRLQEGAVEPAELIERYRRPRPRLDAGSALSPLVSAMMDVSDGLLIDAGRLAGASGCRAVVQLSSIPISPAFLSSVGGDRDARLLAATAGDDYELLFAAPPEREGELVALQDRLGLAFSRIGTLEHGGGLRLVDNGTVTLPESLGWEHD
jgi:thiamine-monophosphate kinase